MKEKPARISVSDKDISKLKEFRIEYKKIHGTLLPYNKMISNLIGKAKLKDIE